MPAPPVPAQLTPIEMTHIAAFPSILRLLASFALIDELGQTATAKLQTLQTIKFHRVIDNEEMTLTGEQFWVQMNYQLVHLLDFLPVAHWEEHADDMFLQQFGPLHAIMTRAEKVMARVDFELTSIDSGSDGRPLSLASFIKMVVPRSMTTKYVKLFSSKVGHSLDYTISWG